MVMKIMKYVVPCVMLFLIIGVSLQYYIATELEPEELVCHKGKLLSLVDSESRVYTKTKGIDCEYEKGMLIIEERK
jgi:hypothetical protein